jgi:3-deoxy-D-manno-octulosonate 8-phosphate phosphatase KdsC-like HAD superfamily phosphatase
VAPANARAEVRARAAIVTWAGGGHGAVRELAERLRRARYAGVALVAGAGAAKG